MPKKEDALVIVESPTKIKTIKHFLGKGFKIDSSMGHVIDLPRKKMGIDPKKNFEPEYVVLSDKKKVLTRLKKEIKGIDKLYLATDPDREGEAIGWHLATRLGKDKKVYRVTFNEITKKAVKEAFASPADIDMDKVNAQQARRILDRIVGYSLSPLLWRKVGRGLSAGRVQSVTVRLIVEREEKIKAFTPQEYWEIEANLEKILTKEDFLTKLIEIDDKKFQLEDESSASQLVDEVSSDEFIVKDIKKRKQRKHPFPPFTTSSLQQAAFNKFHFTATKTMRIAQRLYEGMEIGKKGNIGLITYMRTDSVRVADSALKECRHYIKKNFGEAYLPVQPNRYRSRRGAQGAHEAIRPTSAERSPESIEKYLEPEEYKLYEMIWRQFVASQMTSAVYDVKTVDIKAGRCLFRATGSSCIFKGFNVLLKEKEEEKAIPQLEIGEKLRLIELTPTQHFTKPPPRFTDSSLIKMLEERGIGRPSTYAPIIQNIVTRAYVRREKGALSPTELGTLVTKLLKKHFPKILDVKFTAGMEEELDRIEEGRMEWTRMLKDFYGPFIKKVGKAKISMKNMKKEVVPTDEVCEQCGKPMVIRWGGRGRFLGCSGFPECKFTKSIGTGVMCPNEGCGGELVEKKSKRGRFFYGCSNYPECNYTSYKLPEGKD